MESVPPDIDTSKAYSSMFDDSKQEVSGCQQYVGCIFVLLILPVYISFTCIYFRVFPRINASVASACILSYRVDSRRSTLRSFVLTYKIVHQRHLDEQQADPGGRAAHYCTRTRVYQFPCCSLLSLGVEPISSFESCSVPATMRKTPNLRPGSLGAGGCDAPNPCVEGVPYPT
jgi:hypothetical protein